MVISSIKPEQIVLPKKQHTSYSQIDEYLKCGELYRLKYVEQAPYTAKQEAHFLLGGLVHSVLEKILKDNLSSHEAFDLCLGSWCLNAGLDLDHEKLLEFAQILGPIFTKASKKYRREDAIRNKDGSVPKNVETYPPQSWTAAIRPVKHAIFDWNTQAQRQFPEVFTTHSFSYLIGKAYSYITTFQIPKDFKTLEVEYEISTLKDFGYLRPVNFPGKEEESFFLKVIIDWVVEANKEIIIIDHKTGVTEYTSIDVYHNPQLYLYAYAYEKISGQQVSKIGINHLPTGDIFLVPVNRRILQEVLGTYKAIQESIDAGQFLKTNPTKYFGPCVSRDREKRVTSHCPYLETCWPEYFNRINAI